MYLHQKEVQCTYCVHVVLQITLLRLRWETGKVRDRFGGMVRFKGGKNTQY